MKANKQVFVKLLREFAKNVQNLTDEQFEECAKGNFSIDIKLSKKPSEESDKKKLNKDAPETEIQETVNLLYKTDDRDEGMKILSERCPNKHYLEMLMKHLDTPFLKRDKISRLQDKIIEATIGYRLRSEAIQGKNKNDM